MDDDVSLRAKIASSLRSEFEVLEGKDYEAAFVLLEESELDVLLLGLPISSGGVRECAELLDRLDGSEIDTLVIVLSSDDKKSTALKIIDGGSYDYFTKPVDTDVLRHLIGRAVEKLHIQRENRILRDEISRLVRHALTLGVGTGVGVGDASATFVILAWTQGDAASGRIP